MPHAITLAFLLLSVPPIQDQPAPDRVENWQTDLDELARILSERHKKPFFKVTREDFFKAAAGLRKRIPDLQDHQVIVEFMKLAALLGDGHTGVNPGPEAVVKLRRYPIWLLWFKDGLFVVSAMETHKDLLGARIVAVGKTPVEEAARRVARIYASDNESGSKHLSAVWLAIPEALSCEGLVGDMEKASFTVADAHGHERTVTLAPVAGPSRRVFPFEKLDALSVSRRLGRPRYGVELLPNGKVLYAWYDTCSDAKDRPVSAWCDEVLKAIDDKKPDRVVFDLRRNSGGNSMLINPLLAGLRKRPEATAKGKLVVLVDRATYSSAILNALDFRREFKAPLIGMPPGGSPNHYGEIRRYVLPNCKWEVQYSTKFFKLSEVETDTIKPDVEADWTAAEFFGGKDPVLDAALAWKP
jgi:hypothetical protein